MSSPYTPRLIQDGPHDVTVSNENRHHNLALLGKILAFSHGKSVVWSEIVLGRLGLRSDFVGYETLIGYIDEHDLWSLNGDILEIGAFMGGGTAKFAIASRKYKKAVLVVDVFDPRFDRTQNTRGESMCWIYSAILGKKNLRAQFDRKTSGLDNITVRSEDSMKLILPSDQRFLFSFIDGNHNSANVTSDINFAWAHTVPGGVVACHDYGGDLPSVTSAIDRFCQIMNDGIGKINILHRRKLIFLHKGGKDG